MKENKNKMIISAQSVYCSTPPMLLLLFTLHIKMAVNFIKAKSVSFDAPLDMFIMFIAGISESLSKGLHAYHPVESKQFQRSMLIPPGSHLF